MTVLQKCADLAREAAERHCDTPIEYNMAIDQAVEKHPCCKEHESIYFEVLGKTVFNDSQETTHSDDSGNI